MKLYDTQATINDPDLTLLSFPNQGRSLNENDSANFAVQSPTTMKSYFVLLLLLGLFVLEAMASVPPPQRRGGNKPLRIRLRPRPQSIGVSVDHHSSRECLTVCKWTEPNMLISFSLAAHSHATPMEIDSPRYHSTQTIHHGHGPTPMDIDHVHTSAAHTNNHGPTPMDIDHRPVVHGNGRRPTRVNTLPPRPANGQTTSHARGYSNGHLPKPIEWPTPMHIG